VTFPTIPTDSLPWLTVEQMAQADRLAIEVFGIELLQMMEHAGSGLADVVMSTAPEGEVVVLAGGGNNGGGGLCAARHLVNRGRSVSVVLATDRLGAAAQHHLNTLAAMGATPIGDPPDAPVVIDALVGYGLDGPLRGEAAVLAAWSAGRVVISLDFPSGHGNPGAVEAAATVTLALPKKGLRSVRPLYLVDLGLPDALWATMAIDLASVFANGPVLEIN
jgi:NAD(P)H-hydrate epimerase